MLIEELKDAFKAGIPVEYSAHCQKRMLERNISRADIVNCIYSGEIIEEYPLDDNYSSSSLPACLVLGLKISNDTYIHVVVGFNGKKVLIISAYYPDNVHWLEDLKTRRK